MSEEDGDGGLSDMLTKKASRPARNPPPFPETYVDFSKSKALQEVFIPELEEELGEEVVALRAADHATKLAEDNDYVYAYYRSLQALSWQKEREAREEVGRQFDARRTVGQLKRLLDNFPDEMLVSVVYNDNELGECITCWDGDLFESEEDANEVRIFTKDRP